MVCVSDFSRCRSCDCAGSHFQSRLCRGNFPTTPRVPVNCVSGDNCPSGHPCVLPPDGIARHWIESPSAQRCHGSNRRSDRRKIACFGPTLRPSLTLSPPSLVGLLAFMQVNLTFGEVDTMDQHERNTCMAGGLVDGGGDALVPLCMLPQRGIFEELERGTDAVHDLKAARDISPWSTYV